MQGNKQQQLARMERSESGKYATQHLRRFASYLDRAFRYQKAGFKPKLNMKPIFDVYIVRSVASVRPSNKADCLAAVRSDQREIKDFTRLCERLYNAPNVSKTGVGDCRVN